MSLTDEVVQRQREDTLRAALLKEQRKSAKREDDRAAVIAAMREQIDIAALSVGRADVVPRPKRDRRKSPEAALLHLTDWQLGKLTDTYSMEVCVRRVRTTIAKTLKLAEIQRADHPVRDCHVMLGGDLVENLGIFPGQAYEVEASAFVQLFEAAKLIEECILTLLGPDDDDEGFEHVYVYEVPGNHGRIGRKGDYPRGDNLDLIAGKIARDRLTNQPRLTWHDPSLSRPYQSEEKGRGMVVNPPFWYQIVKAGEYTAMLVHGDQVRSFGGQLPAYGIMRKANAWIGAVKEPFRDLYLGHLHQPMTLQMSHGGLVYMTPSPESGSAYATEFAGAHGQPGQRLHFIDPRRGRVTSSYLLELDD